MNNKVKMKRHESFSIREGWLAKGIRTIKEDSKVFSSADATDILGIGTNMVKSLKYWMTATCLIEESNRSISLSKFGELIDKYDPYLEDNFSWWLIHLNMILNIEDSYIYNLFFNKCTMKVFSKRDIFEQISQILNNNKLEYNENILQDEVNMIIKTYSIDEKIDNPENNFICPLSELNLIKKVDINAYERIKPDFRSLNYLIVYYLMILLSEDKEYLSIDDLIKQDNSPAKLLNLDKNLINEYLDEMKKHDLIIINRTAGLNMIYFNKKLSIDEIMREHFE
jgi:hypothetical protein